MNFAQLFNQNSYVVIALFFFTIISLALWRVHNPGLRYGATVMVALVLIAINFIFRDGVSEIQTMTQFDEILGSRQSVVLEIYSNY